MDNALLLGTGAFVLVATAGVTFVLIRMGTRHVGERERVALVRGGSLTRLAGPGKIFAMPLLDRAVPLAVDDVGTALVEGRAEFGGVDVPIRSSVLLESGDVVRIIGFDREQAAVVLKA